MISDPKNFGISLKREHLTAQLQQPSRSGWLELIAENLLSYDDTDLQKLEKLREDYQLSLHITCLDLGGSDPLSTSFLKRLAGFIDRFQPALISDHLSFCRFQSTYFHELLPIPYHESSLRNFVSRVLKIQDYFQQTIIVENISQYTRYQADTMSEVHFLSELTRLSDCGILLDLNNLIVNQNNLNMDVSHYLLEIPKASIREIHVAAHQTRGDILLDTHDGPASQELLVLLHNFLASIPEHKIPIILEWDHEVPSNFELNEALEKMLGELQSLEASYEKN